MAITSSNGTASNGRPQTRAARRGEEPPLTFRERLQALRNLPAFFRMVWQTSPAMFTANIVLRVVRAAIPLLVLYLAKLIIDEVVTITQTPPPHNLRYLWMLVGAEFGLAVLSDALSRCLSLLDSLLGDLFANRTSIQIMEHAATLDLDQFEDSTFYDKLERARQ
ncbi:MAG: ABC transporter ATP-binding protein, partial [Cytophagales bacterium]|nr:ABC transporter ATP-binding protein [Cytophagales bacterium]